MQAMNVTSAGVQIAPPGKMPFIHIYNNGAEAIFIQYDGDTANPLTTANGMPIPAGGYLQLNNDGHVNNLFDKGVNAICAVGPVEVRLQGV